MSVQSLQALQAQDSLAGDARGRGGEWGESDPRAPSAGGVHPKSETRNPKPGPTRGPRARAEWTRTLNTENRNLKPGPTRGPPARAGLTNDQIVKEEVRDLEDRKHSADFSNPQDANDKESRKPGSASHCLFLDSWLPNS